ncbi:alpha/beta hydrolase family protein [Streptosporangium sp. NBC_01756]|uniref:alpha/beta hydrolase family protein n=1 Tax=Streptosporangium sp. NBC_01756 TaxID=2975950 RepID=UPI002DD7BF71|nr:alpha/beta fold hydrolase [Streptosporangium sp. NBC_01756]WSC89722.1 alpha/beta fold hydrolase [Streptosporangium sp. NBC_01756]
MQPIVFGNDPTFWYETLRSFGHIAYGGADFGEVLVTAQRIEEGDYDSWHDEWRRIADLVATEAERSSSPISRRDGFLRASNYYRSAEFFLHGNPDDPRIHDSHARSVACFRKALPGVQAVQIPYKNTTLPGYHYDCGGDRTVVMHNGFDGSAEEMHFVAAAALAERGFNVLSFDGPGQPGPMHRESLTFRPDWENVIGPVLDWLQADRVALLGNSMGGLLAPRAAAFEPRIQALVALDGVYDMSLVLLDHFGGDRELAARLLRAESAPEIDVLFEQLMATDPGVRWACTHGMWVTGTSTPRSYFADMLDYHLGDGVAERITCPTLVCSAPGDLFFQGQPELLYEHLTCPKTFLEFGADLGSDAHCQAGAQRLAMARIADWLERNF